MAIIDRMLKKLDDDISYMQEGLQPDSLVHWYDIVIREAQNFAPAHLRDKINVIQDPILPMKFNLDISKRAVRYFMMAVDANLEKMPYTTKLYFLQVQQTLTEEIDRALV